MSQFRGRFRIRYIILLFLAAIGYLLWQEQDAFNSDRVLRRPPVTNGFKYRPSSYDWSRARVFHPVKNIKSLPTGKRTHFPRIQARRPAKLDPETIARRDAVRNAFLKSWDAYKAKAWGADELQPLSGQSRTSFGGWGAQLIDALDTLWIMDLKDEFRSAVAHVALIDWARFSGRQINLFEVTIRHLGGLLSAYDLSGEPVLLYKAMELGDTLYAAFDTPNRLPTQYIDVRAARSGKQTADDHISPAVAGSLCLEFTRLTQITGDSKYYDATERVKQFFHRQQNQTDMPGIWPNSFNMRKERPERNVMFTLGAGSDSMYEYLPKMHLLLGGLDPAYEKMTRDALEAARDHLLFRPMTPDDENLLVAGKASTNNNKEVELTGEMEHLACFAGGMYALAGRMLKRGHYVDVGGRITRACVWAYDSFATGLMPEIAELVPCAARNEKCAYDEALLPSGRAKNLPDGFVRVRDTRYQLRPEAIESVFYMWRTTGDKKYRDAAWRMWQSVVREAETDLAFASVEDVRFANGQKEDAMETFWMGETLKYFYLTFDRREMISLDDWVFNTEAHPFKRTK